MLNVFSNFLANVAKNNFNVNSQIKNNKEIKESAILTGEMIKVIIEVALTVQFNFQILEDNQTNHQIKLQPIFKFLQSLFQFVEKTFTF